MSRSIIITMVLLFQGFASGCAMQESMSPSATPGPASRPEGTAPSEYGGAATAIHLERAVHFSSPEGDDVLAPPGGYQVEPTEEAQLRLVPEAEKPPLLIAASITGFDLDVAAPVALTIPYGEDAHHVVLLLPGSTALDSIGSYSGTRSRGPFTLGSPAIKGSLDQKLTAGKSPTYTERSKAAEKFERRASNVTLQPGPRTSNYQPCRMAGSGYIGSVIAEEWRTYKTTGSLPVPAPMLAGIRDWSQASVVLTGAPAATPPTPETGTWKTEKTNPRTPWVRELPGDPYYCVFGSATVTETGMLPFQAGERVQLLVTSIVTGRGYFTYWIEDRYEVTAQGGRSVTFPKVVVAAHYGGANIGFVKWMDVSKEAARRLQNGVFVGYTLQTPSKRIACEYKPDLNNFGQGTVSCPPGEPWPLQQ